MEEPYYIVLEKEFDMVELEGELQRYGNYQPNLVMCLIQFEDNYSKYKNLLLKYQMVSQVVTCFNVKKFNLSKASNILRQVNAKMGGDLYTMKFPPAMDKRRTMLIGIDVCHEGSQSIVGFSASVNPEMSQYYSEHFVQKKGQEIVISNMRETI